MSELPRRFRAGSVLTVLGLSLLGCYADDLLPRLPSPRVPPQIDRERMAAAQAKRDRKAARRRT